MSDKDTIYRQAAIEALEKVAELYPWKVPGNRDSYSQYNEAWQDALNRADSEIEALPSVQPVRKTGQWIKRKKGAIGYDCSCCGKSNISNHFDYCPNCGADMRGEQDIPEEE